MSTDYSAYFDGKFMGPKETDRVLPRARLQNPHRERRPGKQLIDHLTEDELAYRLVRSSRQTQAVDAYREKTYAYWHPFQYPNIGVELGPAGEYNPDGVELDMAPYGAITIEQEEPIVSVVVIGSACVPPGYVILHAEPTVWQYPRTGVKMKVSNLWGQHVRGSLWGLGLDESWEQAGLSSARFDLPDSSKVTIMGGSQNDVGMWQSRSRNRIDEKPDAHYAFRIIRVTVREKVE